MVDWSTIAFIFPGQGSQKVGMGLALAEAYPIAQQTFEQADAILGFNLSAMCFEGSADDLADTVNTQPALYTAGIAALRALQSEIPEAAPAFVAGHSLGEFTALTAAGALAFEDGLRLVRERGRLMKLAGGRSPGAMAALLGLNADAVRDVCDRASQETGGTLVLANDNCPGQIVISGDNATLDHGLELATAAGAKRAIKLAVSIASHSPLMQSVADDFRQVLAETDFTTPQTPLYANVTAQPLETVAQIREELGMQLTHSVRWTESVQAMITAGAEIFLELGSGDVLCGLLKRIDRAKTGLAIESADSINKAREL